MKLRDLLTLLFSKLYNEYKLSGSFAICQQVDKCTPMSWGLHALLCTGGEAVQTGRHFFAVTDGVQFGATLLSLIVPEREFHRTLPFVALLFGMRLITSIRCQLVSEPCA